MNEFNHSYAVLFPSLGDHPVEFFLFGVSVLILVSVLASKISSRLGVPALLLFLVVGMLAGSEGPGGIHFDDPRLVQSIGVAALAFILFAGGMDTNWQSIRPVLWRGFSLSTLGVLITAVLVGWFAHVMLEFSWMTGLLLGAIVSSTDAAAVFSVLRSRKVSLKGTLKPLLEMESGSNDPMAVFLTTGFIMLAIDRNARVADLVPMLIWQMAIGAALGYVMGKASVALTNRLRLEYDGLYSVLTLTLVMFTYGLTALLRGNGFLSVYVVQAISDKKRPKTVKFFPNRSFSFTSCAHGRTRALYLIGTYEKVMPMDIMPAFLLRALAIDDLDEAESLGCLELAEEDLALCSFVYPSKIDHGANLRRVLTQIGHLAGGSGTLSIC